MPMTPAKKVKSELKSTAKKAIKRIKSRVDAGKSQTKKRKVDFSKDDLVLKDFARYSFIVIAIAILAAFFWVISPFFDVLIYAALMVVVFFPIHKWLLKVTKNRRNVSAVFSTLSVVLVFMVPLVLFSIFLIQESINAVQYLSLQISEFNFSGFDPSKIEQWPIIGEYLSSWIDKLDLERYISIDASEVKEILQGMIGEISSGIVNTSGSILAFISGGLEELILIVMKLFVLFLSVFFFFRDGDLILKFIKGLSPLPKKHEEEVERKMKESTYGIVFGNFGTAALQGLVGGIGFAIIGIENALLWGTVMAFSSLVPYLGSALVWGPVAFILFVRGDIGSAIFLTIWGFSVVATVDNIARPFLIGGSAKMHSLPTFLVVLGGLVLFGLKGIIFGPLILGITMTIIHIYELEYAEVLNK